MALHDELASEKTRARGRYAAEQVPSEPQAAGGFPRMEGEKQYRIHHSTEK